MRTLKQEYKEEKRNLLIDAEQIRTATGYCYDHLYHGGCCDSSDRSKVRMEWVRKAQREYISKHKDTILKLAAEMIEDYVAEEE